MGLRGAETQTRTDAERDTVQIDENTLVTSLQDEIYRGEEVADLQHIRLLYVTTICTVGIEGAFLFISSFDGVDFHAYKRCELLLQPQHETRHREPVMTLAELPLCDR